MIYYPLYTLLKIGIKKILIISTPETTPLLEAKLGTGGCELGGAQLTYKIQEQPNGIAQAFILGEEFIGKSKACLSLGDNLFYGN